MTGKGRQTTARSAALTVLGWSASGRVVNYTQEPALARGSRRSAHSSTGSGRSSNPDADAQRAAAPIAVEVVLVDDDSDLNDHSDAAPARQRTSPHAPVGTRRVADAAAAVTQSLELGAGLRSLAQSLSVDAGALLEALAGALRAAPVAAPPASLLSAGEAAALEHAGSLMAMPPVSARASVATAARAAAVQASALTVREVAEMLGRSEVRVRQRLADHSLLGVRAGNAWRVPAFQFESGAELPGWDRVMAALPRDVHPLTVARFLDRRHPDLDLDGQPTSPRAWLRAGADPRAVVEIAAGLHTLP